MEDKLYNENNDFDKYEENNIENVKKIKKKFCWWLFLISLVGGLLAIFLIQIPALIIIAISLVLCFIYRKKYLVWPQLVVIIPNLIMLLFFMYTFLSGNVSNY